MLFKKTLYIYFIAQLFLLKVVGQTSGNVPDTFIATPVVIHQDERIEVLVNKKIFVETIETKVKTIAAADPEKKVKIDKYGRVNVPGYRLQLMNSTDRTAVYDMKGKLYQLYPQIKQYVIAQAPFYKLRFGNFRTKEEAEKYKKALSGMFPNGIFVIDDIIEAQINPKYKETPVNELPKNTAKDKAKNTKTTPKTNSTINPATGNTKITLNTKKKEAPKTKAPAKTTTKPTTATKGKTTTTKKN